MLTQNVNLTSDKYGVAQIVHMVQGDNGRILRCVVDDYSIPSGSTASISFERPDGNVYTQSCQISNNVISTTISSTMLGIAGRAIATVHIVSAGTIVSTFRLVVHVDASAGFAVNPSPADNNVYVYINGQQIQVAKMSDLDQVADDVKAELEGEISQLSESITDLVVTRYECEAVIDNYGINGGTGSIESDTMAVCSDFIDLGGHLDGKKIRFNCNLRSWKGFAFYDEDKKFIIGIYGNNATEHGYIPSSVNKIIEVIPKNARYIRIQRRKDDGYSKPSDIYIEYVKTNILANEINDVLKYRTDIDFDNDVTPNKKINLNGTVSNDDNLSITKIYHVSPGDTVILNVGGSASNIALSKFENNRYTSLVNSVSATTPNNHYEYVVTEEMDVVVNFRHQIGYANNGYIRTTFKDIQNSLSSKCYVSKNGSDLNNGSANTPFASIQYAINRGYKQIFVADGVYDESIVISGKSYISIQKSDVTNDNKIIVKTLVVTDSSNIDISDVDVNSENIDTACVSITRCNKVLMKNCIARNGVKSGFVIETSNGTFTACEAHNIGNDAYYNSDGFNIHGFGYTEFIDCIAYDCYDDGISHHDGCKGKISGGEFYNCTHGGGIAPAGSVNIKIDNVYVHDCYRGMEFTGTGNNSYVSNSVCINNNKDIYVSESAIKSYNLKYASKDLRGGEIIEL